MDTDKSNMPQTAGTDTTRQESLFIKLLLPAMAFFATWGDGLQQIIPFQASKIFVVLTGLLLLHWVLVMRAKLAFPRAMTLFVLFMLLHTIVVFTLIPQEFSFGKTGISTIQSGFERIGESIDITILRVFTFIAMAYALAREIKNRNQIVIFSFFYACGLLAVYLMGGYVMTDLYETRQAGGYLDPNSFGLSGLIAVFLGIISFNYADNLRWKLLSLLGPLTGVMVLLASSSRGNMVGTFCGVLLLIAVSKLGQKLKTVLIIACILVISLLSLPDEYLQTLNLRFDLNRLTYDKGAGRLIIWQDYLRYWKDYVVTGVGLERSMTVLTNRCTRYQVPHNVYIQLLVEFGLPGLLLFLAAIVTFFRRLRNIPGKYPFMAILTAWLVSSFFLGTLESRDTWLIFGIICGACRIATQQDTPAGSRGR